jgi:Mg/Co/Ni transporter MgtE
MAAGLPIEGPAAQRPNAGRLARADVPRARLDEKLDTVQNRVRSSDWDCAIVVNNASVVLGFLDSKALEADAQLTVEQVMQSGPLTVRPNLELEHLRHRMSDKGPDHVIVTDQDGRLLGLVVPADTQ